MTSIIITIFVIGYIAIALEHTIKLDKAASALITGVLVWTVYIVSGADPHHVNEQLTEHLGELSGILFFLLGAMTVVELIDAHDGFNLITDRITQTNKVKLMWIVSFLTFFMSALLDNLTTTIVMISLLKKLIKNDTDRLYFAGLVVIAANAGGAWSPIGDVTTTMLWIGGQITAPNITYKTLLPSIICLLIPLSFISLKLKGNIEKADIIPSRHKAVPVKHQKIVLFSGIAMLLFVPVFKTATHLPPFMGILFGLGLLWFITELLHSDKHDNDKQHLSLAHALQKIDTPSILFFLGILISIAALQSTGILVSAAEYLTTHIANQNITVVTIGLLSSIVDNVPLVAAAQGMFDLTQYPTDHYFWSFLAYSTGTGGSALIIGSAAGVAAMGMEKIKFFWYLKNISWLAILGFFGGAFAYILQEMLLK